jgi:hypothetical protein
VQRASYEQVTPAQAMGRFRSLSRALALSGFRPPVVREFQIAYAGGRVKGRTPAP